MTPVICSKPCESCPYRKDVPSGVWHEQEYLKLAEYDKETQDQPIGVFLCHAADREKTLCRGWVEVHGKQSGEKDLLCTRIQIDREFLDVEPCGIPLYSSGQEAMEAGLREVDFPSQEAIDLMIKIQRKLNERNYNSAGH